MFELDILPEWLLIGKTSNSREWLQTPWTFPSDSSCLPLRPLCRALMNSQLSSNSKEVVHLFIKQKEPVLIVDQLDDGSASIKVPGLLSTHFYTLQSNSPIQFCLVTTQTVMRVCELHTDKSHCFSTSPSKIFQMELPSNLMPILHTHTHTHRLLF